MHHTLQGTPENKFEHNIDKLGAFVREELLSDATHNTDSPFRRIRVDPEHKDFEVPLNQPHTMVAEGDDLSSRWALMRDFADEVNSTGYEYRPIDRVCSGAALVATRRQIRTRERPHPARCLGFSAASRCRPCRFRHRSGACQIIPTLRAGATGSSFWQARPLRVRDSLRCRGRLPAGSMAGQSQIFLRRRANHRHSVSLAAIDRTNRARAGNPPRAFCISLLNRNC